MKKLLQLSLPVSIVIGSTVWAQTGIPGTFGSTLNQWNSHWRSQTLYCLKNPEPLVCSDPVAAICDSPTPEAALKPRAEVIQNLMARMPKGMQDADFLEKNSAQLAKLREEYDELMKAIWGHYLKEPETVRAKGFQPYLDGEDSPLADFKKRYQAILKRRQDYLVALDQAMTAELARNGIDLNRDLVGPLKKSLVEQVYTKDVFQREVIVPESLTSKKPDPRKALRLKGLPDFNLPPIAKDNTTVVIPGLTLAKQAPVPVEETFGPFDLSKVINKIRLLNGQFFKEASNPKFAGRLAGCGGLDHLNANLLSAYQDPSILICPGQLIEILRGQDVQGIAFMIGHELGHSISSNQNYVSINTDPAQRLMKILFGDLDRDENSGKPVLKAQKINELLGESQPSLKEVERRTKLSEHYGNFLSCMRNNYYPEISTYGKVPSYLIQWVLPEIERMMKVTRADYTLSASEKKRRLKGLGIYQAAIKKIEAQQKSCGSAGSQNARGSGGGHGGSGHAPASSHESVLVCISPNTPFEGFDDELVADALAQDAFIKAIRLKKPQERMALARTAFAAFCDGRESIALTHPPARARINPIFNRPEVRQLFGCVTPAKIPVCPLKK